MLYQEFLVRENGQDKKLGILGETHLYRAEETELAREIVPEFKNIALEGSSKSDSIQMIGYLFLPATIAYAAATQRSFPLLKKFPFLDYHEDTEDIARRMKKNIHYLEEDLDEQFSLGQKIALATCVFGTIPLTPFIYARYKLREEKVQSAPENTTSITYRLANALADVARRDEVMAARSATLLRSRDNLLINCGEVHIVGIIDHLNRYMLLEQTREESPDYRY